LRLGDAPAAYLFVALSMMVHEFGHASAVRRCGGENGGIGFGTLFIFPVFYSDVTAMWRFTRKRRALVDLGGMYFQLGLNAVYILLYAATGLSSLLVTAHVVNFLILYNLLPVLRLDGYWLYSDLIGLPDLHNRSQKLTLGLLDKIRGRGGRLADLVVRDVRNPRVAKAALVYAVFCQLVYLVFSVYVVKLGVAMFYRHHQTFQKVAETIARFTSAKTVGEVGAELIRLALSSSMGMFVMIVIFIMLFRLARVRLSAKER
jgi:putative peptide zinc metalloprotease protein